MEKPNALHRAMVPGKINFSAASTSPVDISLKSTTHLSQTEIPEEAPEGTPEEFQSSTSLSMFCSQWSASEIMPL